MKYALKIAATIGHAIKWLTMAITFPLEASGYIAHWLYSFAFIGWYKAGKHMDKLADRYEVRK